MMEDSIYGMFFAVPQDQKKIDLSPEELQKQLDMHFQQIFVADELDHYD
jgi:hypothetical protein